MRALFIAATASLIIGGSTLFAETPAELRFLIGTWESPKVDVKK